MENEEWDPMLKDFHDERFNSYRVSAAAGPSTDGFVDLFVGGIPVTLTENGLQNLFSSVVQVRRVNLVPSRGFGFVSVRQKDAIKVIAHFNNYQLADKYLTVKYSKPKKKPEECDGTEHGTGTVASPVSGSVSQTTQFLSDAKLVSDFNVPALTYPTAAKYLHLGQKLGVKVCDIVTPSQFWVCSDPYDHRNHVTELHAKMQQHYSALPLKSGFRPTGSCLYAAKMKNCGTWCRVLSLSFDTESVLVLCLDFGSLERFRLTELHPLEGQFCSLPFQAIWCRLARIQATPRWGSEAVDWMKGVLTSKQLTVVVCNIAEHVVSVELVLSTGQNMNDALVSRNYARYEKDFSVNLLQTKSDNACALPASAELGGPVETDWKDYPTLKCMTHLPLKVGEQYDTIVQHTRNADDVTVCLQSNTDKLLKLMAEMKNCCPSGIYFPQVGEVVAAQEPTDCMWYRAEVVSLDNVDTATVRFIDFGNTSTVNLKSLMKLNSDHLSTPVFGINVMFSAHVNNELLAEFLPLRLKIIAKQGTHYVVSLASEAEITSPLSHFISEIKQQPHLEINKMYKAFVTDATNAEEFFVHVSGVDYITVEEVMQLFYSDTCGGGYEPKQAGELVVVHLDEDDSWYRAVVLEIKDQATFKCQLIDFGSIITTSLKDITYFDSNLLSHPAVAFKCTFHDAVVSTASSWKADYLMPMNAVYNLTVVDTQNSLHFVDIVNIASNEDWKQKLITDGVLIKRKAGVLQSVHLATNLPAGEDSSNKVDRFSATDIQCLKGRADADHGPSSQHSPCFVADQHRVGESDHLLPHLSDTEIHRLVQSGERVLVVHANNPSDFYIRSAAGTAEMKLASLQGSLKKYCQGAPEVMNIDTSKIVGVLYDGVWYRGIVMGFDPHAGYRVFIVDIGITKTASCAELRPIPHELAVFLPRQALHCAIDRVVGCEPDGSWSSSAIKWFNNVCEKYDFKLKFLFRNDAKSMWLVDLMNEASGKTVKDVLLSQKLAVTKANFSKRSVSKTVPEPVQPVSAVVGNERPLRNEINSEPSGPVTGVSNVAGNKPVINNEVHVNSSVTKANFFSKPSVSKTAQEPVKPVSAVVNNERPPRNEVNSEPSRHATGVSDVAGSKQEMRNKMNSLVLSSEVEQALIQVNETVSVTCIHSPSSFYVQKQHRDRAKVFQLLNSHQTTQMYHPKQVGELIAVMVNDNWHRAEVLSISTDTANVYLIDYGNNIIDLDFAHIRVLPRHFATALPRLAVCCGIAGVTGTQGVGSYAKAGIRWFRDNYLQVDCTLTEATPAKSLSTLLVNLKSSSSKKDARQMLLDYDMAQAITGADPSVDVVQQAANAMQVHKPQSSVLPTVHTSKQTAQYKDPHPLNVGDVASVVYVTSPMDFYVMPASPAALQEVLTLSQQLLQYCTESSGTDYHSPFVNEPVAAKFEGEWFRAEVIKMLGDNCVEVFFVDYGNTEVVSVGDVRSLPKDFIKMSKQAVLCGIDGITSTQSGQEFEQASVEWFKEFCCGLNVSMTSIRIGSDRRKHMVNFVIDASGDQLSAKEKLVASGFARSAD